MLPTIGPGDLLDYTMNFGPYPGNPGWLDPGDSIASAQWSDSPTGLTATVVDTGGAIPAGTYYLVVTGVSGSGETGPSNEVTVTVTGPNSCVELEWDAMPGMASYNIYVGSSAAGENTMIGSAGEPKSTMDGVSGVAATPPAGLVIQSTPAPSTTDTAATVWLQAPAGAPAATYTVSCMVTTTAGRKKSASMQVPVGFS